jgi:phosphopantothenoylcysteine decarboxylase/phosphopantothenate--cysteine ligase
VARVILGVGAGIAAYKACELLRLLKESGHRVTVIPTPDALRFVGEPTWAALSGEPVATDVWTNVPEVPHVRLGQTADLVLVAPATADVLARAAAGLAADLLTTTLLTARCPVLYAPAMHTEMWEHPATQHNVATLRDRGAIVVEPAVGRLTGADSGKGRLPEPAELYALAESVLSSGTAVFPATGTDSAPAPFRTLAGRRVLVSAGGTREELDPVRFLGNWSTGRQGYAFARSAAARGADVTVVAANVELPDPAGAKIIRVVSARDMLAAMLHEAATADVIVMTAAVADFRPVTRAGRKVKKDGTGALPPPIELAENPDIVVALSAQRRERGPAGQVIVSFAAETDPDLEQARAKLARKGSDYQVMNEVGGGKAFGTADNEAVILAADGTITPIPRRSKDALAAVVWDLVAARLG